MNLAKKGRFHFSLFKVDSQNSKFSLEYLTHKIYVTVCGKFSELHFDTFFSPIRGRRFEKQEKLCHIVFLAFQTFSPGLDKMKHQSVVLRVVHTL